MKIIISILILSITIQTLSGLRSLSRDKMGNIRKKMNRTAPLILNGWLWIGCGIFWYIPLCISLKSTPTNDLIGSLMFLFLFCFLPSCWGINGVIGTIFERCSIVGYSDSYGTNVDYKKTWSEIIERKVNQ